MTDEQKTRVRELRAEGLGYIKVADAVGISVNTVKTFCRRNGLTGTVTAPQHTCRFCGKPVELTRGKRIREYCDDKCRSKWWSAHRNELSQKITYTHRCQNCGKEFTIYGKRERKYCSHGCYIEGRFGRHDEGRVQERSTVPGIDESLP